MKNYIKIICVVFFVGFFCSCEKYLEKKSNQSLVIINTLGDLQALLDNVGIINLQGPSADLASSDDNFIRFNDFQALVSQEDRNLYTWQPSNVFLPYTVSPNDWARLYNTIYVANVVLDNIDKIEKTSQNLASWNNVKGQALFTRAHCFFKLLTIWSLAYDETNSNEDLGIPLRQSSDFNKLSIRANVKDSYDLVTEDLESASGLLSTSPIHPYRAGKGAAFGLLSRVYLSMRKYDAALRSSESSLAITNTLVDYNTLSSVAAFPIPQFNKEVIYACSTDGGPLLNRNRARVDTTLIRKYETNDLRRQIFFDTQADGTCIFKGSYEGKITLFNGISVNEILLTRAECKVRAGLITEGLADLNTLLKNRYKTGTFTGISGLSTQESLTRILLERQKELVMRGTRWIDIKRLNKENANIGLRRILNSNTFTLPPNDLRFALAIPEDVVSLGQIPQNPR
ncbi:MAG: RagB/SusD family nutrient uptake outer membrane protein [Chryseobacterium sp.]|nr:MAG: RagB/SusD family nutrient uptake outer membrane protein [Chryseobacterium sp.]